VGFSVEVVQPTQEKENPALEQTKISKGARDVKLSFYVVWKKE